MEKIGTEENRDYKYVMQDTGNVYLGSKFSYKELIEDESVPFKLKAILERYILQNLDLSVTLESHIYYMKPEGFDFQSYKQLRAKVKYNILVQKKNLFGKKKAHYITKVLPIEKFVLLNVNEKNKSHIVIQEIAISKLGLMTFTV